MCLNHTLFHPWYFIVYLILIFFFFKKKTTKTTSVDTISGLSRDAVLMLDVGTYDVKAKVTKG